jgi:hypothetical protein
MLQLQIISKWPLLSLSSITMCVLAYFFDWPIIRCHLTRDWSGVLRPPRTSSTQVSPSRVWLREEVFQVDQDVGGLALVFALPGGLESDRKLYPIKKSVLLSNLNHDIGSNILTIKCLNFWFINSNWQYFFFNGNN